jgi:DNA-binding response OmpR family regulator
MRKILIVDDDPDIGEALEHLLGHTYGVARAENGYSAMEKVKAEEYDLILLDLRMPGLDGAGFVKALRRGGNETPILVVSASDHAAEQAHAIDAADYIVKPFHVDELDAKIEQIMGIYNGPLV